ncbi:MAG: type I polyketide synthase, partial [Candidatus Eisenbacteria bacterium]
ELDLDPALFQVAAARANWPRGEVPRRAGVSSFGIGGTNAHVVLEEAPAPAARAAETGPQLLLLSARTDAALDALGESLARHLERQPELELRDVAHTLQVGRTPLERRRTVIAGSPAEAVRLLRAGGGPGGDRVQAPQDSPPVCLLFPGQGAQHAGMGEALYGDDPRFREDIDRCAGILAPHLGFDLRPVLYPGARGGDESARRLARTGVAQPALFIVEYALARRWLDAGVKPDGMLGHSLGEFVAAVLAGVFPLEDALPLVAERGRLMEAMPGGAMDAVALAEEALRPLLDQAGAMVSLAAVNSPAQCTVSGTFEGMAAFEEQLRGRGVAWKRLDTSHAFHSAMMEPALAPFGEAVARVRLQAPVRRFVSSVTGDWITPQEACDPAYWVRQMRQPVRFGDAFGRLVEGRNPVLLEVGPGTALGGLARRLSRAHPVVSSLLPPAAAPGAGGEAADAAGLLPAAGVLWSHGVVLDWPGFASRADRRRVPLPGYPFERTRHWIERDPAGASPRPKALHKRADPSSWFYFPSWRRAGPAALARPAGSEEPARWLVLGAGAGVAPLADELAARGRTVTRVEFGARFARLAADRFRVDPRSAADFADLLAGLREAGALPEAVAYVAGDVPDPASSPAAGGVAADVAGFLHLVRALAHHAPGHRIELGLVTCGLRDVFGRVEGSLALGALPGLCKVASQEFPQFACRNVDVEGDGLDAPSPASLRLLGDELCARPVAPVVALRGGQRWLPAFEAMPAAPADAARAIPAGSHVVVTGGLGRYGLALAAHLARHHRARVSLLDIAVPGPEFRTLAADGGVRFVRADVADESAVRVALAGAVEAFGPIHGLVHAAGHREEGAYRTLEETEPAHVAAHLAPKLAGLAVLDRVLAGGGLAFATITSSLAAILGGVGLAAFAAADAAVEAFARSRAGGPGVPWQNVAWEAWGEPVFDEAHRVLGRQQAGLLLTLPEAMVAFDRLVALHDLPQVAIATGDLELRRAQWTRVGEPAEPRPPATSGTNRPVELADPSMSDVELRIAGIWRDALGVEAIGPDD